MSIIHFQALNDMEITEDSLNLCTLVEFWGLNTTSVLELTVAFFHSEEAAPSLR